MKYKYPPLVWALCILLGINFILSFSLLFKRGGEGEEQGRRWKTQVETRWREDFKSWKRKLIENRGDDLSRAKSDWGKMMDLQLERALRSYLSRTDWEREKRGFLSRAEWDTAKKGLLNRREWTKWKKRNPEIQRIQNEIGKLQKSLQTTRATLLKLQKASRTEKGSVLEELNKIAKTLTILKSIDDKLQEIKKKILPPKKRLEPPKTPKGKKGKNKKKTGKNLKEKP